MPAPAQAVDKSPTVDIGEYQHGFSYPDQSVFKTRKGLDEEVVNAISHHKGEPEWMRQFRLRALSAFRKKSMPNWGADLSDLDFDNLYYYAKPQGEQTRSWEEVPANIKETFDRLGIPQAERKFLAGVGAQYDSEMVYHSINADLAKLGVIFTDPETAVREHPDLVRQYFGTVIPYLDNKFAALNSAVWSGGSFVYVPKGVKVEIPLQAYFRINAKSFGQFERTLIIADEGSFVHYIEGCTAPDLRHRVAAQRRGGDHRPAGLPGPLHHHPELVQRRVQPGDQTRARPQGCHRGVGGRQHRLQADHEVPLDLPGWRGSARRGPVHRLCRQRAAAGHRRARRCTPPATPAAVITAKSISRAGGVASYRGLLKVNEGLHDVRSRVVCDALILDEKSSSNTFPYMEINSDDVSIEHEARVSRISEEQLFYLMSRGMSEQEASVMIVNGFLDPLVKQLPMEYAVELNRLIELEMTGTVG